jgi:hypothetical protein
LDAHVRAWRGGVPAPAGLALEVMLAGLAALAVGEKLVAGRPSGGLLGAFPARLALIQGA